MEEDIQHVYFEALYTAYKERNAALVDAANEYGRIAGIADEQRDKINDLLREILLFPNAA